MASDDGYTLKQRLAETLTESSKGTTPFDIQIVRGTLLTQILDSSGSVSDPDYASAKMSAAMLVDSLGDDTAVGITQFANSVSVELPLTLDREAAKRKLLGMHRLNGNTATHLALQVAGASSTGRASAMRMVWLFTDGNPNHQNLTVRAGTMLRNMSVALIGVGIGQVDKARLEQVCGIGNVYVLTDWAALREAIPMAGDNNRRFVRGSELEMAFKQTHTVVGFRDPLHLKVEITNVGDVDVVAGALVRIEAGEFYQQSVHQIKSTIPNHGGVYEFEHQLKPTGNANIRTMPDTIFFTVVNPTTKLTYKSKYAGIVLEPYTLMGDVINWQPKFTDVADAARILVFGYAGTGKSTLINNFLSLYTIENAEDAPAFASDSHVTTENQAYFHSKSPQIKYLDTVGLNSARDNYSSEILKGIVEGTIPHDFRVNDENLADAKRRAQFAADEQREMHTAIIVTTCLIIHEDDEAKRRLRSYIQDLARFHMSPMVVVTRIDGISDDDELRALPKQISDLTGLPVSKIFLLDNQPLAENDPGLVKQRKAVFSILRTALESVTRRHELMSRPPGTNQRQTPPSQVNSAQFQNSHPSAATSVSLPPSSSPGTSGQQPRASGSAFAAPSGLTYNFSTWTNSLPPAAPIHAVTSPTVAPPSSTPSGGDAITEYIVVSADDGAILGEVCQEIRLNDPLVNVREQIRNEGIEFGSYVFVSSASRAPLSSVQEQKAPVSRATTSHQTGATAVLVKQLSIGPSQSPPSYK